MTIIDRPQSEVIIFDHLPPEAAAMALAMYSRDPRSVRTHLEKVAEVGPEKFMGTYYVGYGHKSIGDCGSTTICAENISMLAAKAVQNNRLYNGQEASTRYLDMSAQPVLNPLGTDAGKEIQSNWMSFYTKVFEALIPYLNELYPMLESDKASDYKKAIKAKAYDIARAFLPAGCTTYVGWHTNLRQAWDHIKDMLIHPLQEVRDLANLMLKEVREKYPNSFSFDLRPEQTSYMEKCAQWTYRHPRVGRDFSYTHTINRDRLTRHSSTVHLLTSRPPKTELPDWFDRYGQIQFRFKLDFGSFRDIQRQRSCTQIMPLLTTHYGFHDWYLAQLPTEMRREAFNLLDTQCAEIARIKDPELRQYYIAMGYQVGCEITAGLPSAVYISELRSGQTVHPTLRPIAQKMGGVIREIVPEMVIHTDMSPDEWSTKRGKHDIVKKESV
jgi:thymidylate synthase ThyX